MNNVKGNGPCSEADGPNAEGRAGVRLEHNREAHCYTTCRNSASAILVETVFSNVLLTVSLTCFRPFLLCSSNLSILTHHPVVLIPRGKDTSNRTMHPAIRHTIVRETPQRLHIFEWFPTIIHDNDLFSDSQVDTICGRYSKEAFGI
ncbi:hypothetical protein TNCV_4395581 [Trichonephila clavipes]|uniref:Uncharacterized protein n=1 Tax=Trichonephila clavipes TaxID=2585209 RepID=A0A8X6W4X9_TRICX|nr:hypothetical protein TNCV_4395581 [Trichonephila clavipes]